jgi:hypothetical protein
MDHSTACPLCRQEIPVYVYATDQPCNKVVLSISMWSLSLPFFMSAPIDHDLSSFESVS